MSTFHLIVPLKEVFDHGENSWLEDAGIVVAPPASGRYPSRLEVLDLLRSHGIPDRHIHEALNEFTVDFADEVLKAHATVSITFESSLSNGLVAERIVARGHQALVINLVLALETICGGPFLVVVNGETPVLVQEW